jgi:hypothetical protein
MPLKSRPNGRLFCFPPPEKIYGIQFRGKYPGLFSIVTHPALQGNIKARVTTNVEVTPLKNADSACVFKDALRMLSNIAAERKTGQTFL